MDCYFRQEWRDTRLMFDPLGNLTIIRPSIKMLDDIWKPDSFFLNGQDSYLHTITYSNKLFRIHSNGEILYSQR
jgi:gamma-aminobutyric acid receptor subunit alpha